MFENLEILYENNNLKASLVVKQKFVSKIDKKLLLNFINANGIVYGIDEDSVNNFLYLVKTKRIEKKPYPIAVGLKPKDGKNGEICITAISGEKKKIVDTDIYLNVKVDFRELIKEEPIVVEPNDIVGFYIPPERGEPGINIKGEIIPSQDGKDLHIIVGSNVEFINNKFVSKIKGALKFNIEDNKAYINVIDVIVIDGDVDYSTGNIDFPGTVIIKGEVKSSFEVSAEADIYATRVFCATLKAKGNIIIKEGILGDKLNNKKSYCSAGGLVKANYIQYSKVESGDRTIVSRYILHSSIYSDERVDVLGYPGKIIGGEIIAHLGINSKIYGSKSGIYTKLVAGVPYKMYLYYEQLLNEYAVIDKEIKAISFYLGNIGKSKDELPESVETLNSKRLLYKNRLVELKKNIEILKENISKYMPIKICVKECIYPGVEININGIRMLNKNRKGNGCFVLDNRRREILFVDTF